MTHSKDILIQPHHLNHGGTVFGGNMMAWADEMAFIAATLTYPKCTFVTKLFGEFNFIRGSKEGDIVRIQAQILKTGRTSVTIGIKASNAITGEDLFHTRAVMVNVKHGKSTPILPARVV